MTITATAPEALSTDPYFLTDAEIEEMEAAMAEFPVSDEDMNWYLEAAYVDPNEVEGPCCGDRLCPCPKW